MALKIKTAQTDYSKFSREEQGWIYNALDCCLTDEIYNVLSAKLVDSLQYAQPSYDFVRAMQGPSMAMSLRGMKIDCNLRSELITDLEAQVDYYRGRVQRMVAEIWRDDFNPNSPLQVKQLLYKILNAPVQYKWNGATKRRQESTNKEALEAVIAGPTFYARPIAKHILKVRELVKLIGTLRTGIDPDGRMRTSYNVSGTETGRWSSNSNVFGTGTNLQNITNDLREIFIADTGMKFAYIDGEQAESRVVGYLSGDQAYIDACEGGDLHSIVAQMVWPELEWTGDLHHDKHVVAGASFHGRMSYRDASKRLGHGTNYLGSAPMMAKNTGIPLKLVVDFQSRYFFAFPGIPRWHQGVATELQTTGCLTTPMGRTRYFFGRLDSDDTLKEAIAFVPQSVIGEWLNLAMYRVWEKHDLGGDVRLTAQIHDAILIQYPDRGPEYQRKILAEITETMTFPIPTQAGDCIIPVGVEGVGWNWRVWDDRGSNTPNPDSLMEIGQDEKLKRTRQRTTKTATSLLTRKL